MGAKGVRKEPHVAWIVPYAPGVIESCASKGGEAMVTAKRETAGVASKRVLLPNRGMFSADGEDVVMFAVEAHDAQGRVVPIPIKRGISVNLTNLLT